MRGPALQAEVVAPPLERRDAQRLALDARQQRLHDRQVLLDQLLLQADRVGRHDDALAAAQGLQRRGHQIRQRLAGTGPRLDDEVLAVCSRAWFTADGHRSCSGRRSNSGKKLLQLPAPAAAAPRPLRPRPDASRPPLRGLRDLLRAAPASPP